MVLLTMDLARRLTAPIGLACPCRPRLPLSASPAPMARRTARHWYSALGSGFGSRHWVFLLSVLYISPYFSFSLDRQTIHHLLHLLVSTGYEPGTEMNSTPTLSFCYSLSSAPVPVD